MPLIMLDLTRRKPRHAKPAPAKPPIHVDHDSAAPDPRRWLTLAVVLGAAFLGTLDFFIVNVAMPAIQANLGATSAQLQLVIAAYGLTYAVCLITGGRLGDIYGRKRVFLIGMASFTVASVLCGVAPGPVFLIAARALQGVTASLMFPQVLAIVQVTFPPAERRVAFGIFGTVQGAAALSGLVLGGLLVQNDPLGLGWRPIFLVNLPLGVLALAAAWRLVPESRSSHALRLDLGGVAIVSVGLFLLIFPLAEGREADWPPWAFACLALAGPTLAAFVWHQRRLAARGGSPLVELSLFRSRVFVVGLLMSLTFCGGLSAFFLTMTLFLQLGLGLRPTDTSLVFVPFAAGYLVASSLAVPLARRFGSRVLQLGAALMAASLGGVVALALTRGQALNSIDLMPVLLAYGVGQGFVFPLLIATVLGGIPKADAGSAAGVLSTFQQVAFSVGIALIGSVFFATLGHQRGPTAYPYAVTAAFACNIALLGATFGLAFLLPRHLAADVPVVPVEV
jgi:EmrB/QacA subfamily drug resistance transporter